MKLSWFPMNIVKSQSQANTASISELRGESSQGESQRICIHSLGISGRGMPSLVTAAQTPGAVSQQRNPMPYFSLCY